MKTLEKTQLDDIKTAVAYFDKSSDELLDMIVKQAKARKAQYFAFTDPISSVCLVLGNEAKNSVDCELPIDGNYYDTRTLLVKKLVFVVRDENIAEILKKSSQKMISNLLYQVFNNVQLSAYHRGYRYVNLDLKKGFSSKCFILK